MGTATLRIRATAIAVGVGVVLSSFALMATTYACWVAGHHARALIPGIACLVIGWGAASLLLATARRAIDRAVDRLAAAAAGDLIAPVPRATTVLMPRLADAMTALFTQLSSNFDHVRHLALYDPVTGLANRANFRAGAEAVLSRIGDSAAALFFIDLDRFKAVNDSRGHASGDQLLMRVADRLRTIGDESGTPGTIVGRLAGDEFTILCPGMADAAAVQRLGQAIVAALGQPFALSDGLVTIGASVGVALRPDHGTTLHELMRAADAAMYQAKRDGRGRIARYSEGLAAELTGRDLLDQELRDALDRDEFALLFQPQIAAAGDRALVAAEALLRWRHPSGELRPAGDFLKRAEANGQMVAIGDWVTTAVARTAADWHREGRPGRIALNLNQRQLEDRAFVPRLRAALEDVGAPLTCIELEIGEAFAMRCPAPTIAALAELRADGARITIDDFGAGDSNLQRLRQLPVDRVKLDRTLVREVAHDRVAREIVQALVGLIHGLGFEAIAEGVETEAAADVLRVLGCDAIQGWVIARPMDAAALAGWLDRPRAGAAGR
ncbi:hypothetical protein ASG29_14060 [Sphingomonas sp. Leaf412]|uniref:putative bifunctional diguanylate cyclase/phosphodiesterase n=1 Tax=Sphingomonas sp. Leaf412 TaxID=1736370 RepID=UPI0006F1C4CA|nr:EAL domain-containing protein [Sphingomonas sp. Leaf412]KQT33036.1 hypothetical protein ASG29_14060 [Sphingomonas sp. Leaf412]